MVTAITALKDPEKTWQQRALSSLEESLGQPLDLWTCSQAGDWQLSDAAEFSVVEQTPELFSLLTSVNGQAVPVACEQTPGHHLLAIPLGRQSVGITRVQTDRPEILVGLAEVATRFFCQQEEVARLREENDFFLKQVSEDFEELTFLRAMAQRLGLGDSTHTIEQLVTVSLPELGKSTHSEELHFVQTTQEVVASWRSEEVCRAPLATATVIALVAAQCPPAECQPQIKNGFDQTTAGPQLAGVRDFIIVPVVLDQAPLGWFVAINRIAEDQAETHVFPEWRLNQHEFGTSEASLLSTAAAMTSSHANNLALFQEREALLVNVVRTLVSAVEAKDQYTCGHSERVALYAKRLAEQLGYDQQACELLYLTGLLHDIGKIAINDAILNKPDRLTDEEFAEIQRHPDEGWKILQELQQLSYVLPGVLHHHERVDGKGYPDGLSGPAIPRDGRVLAVADAYDAMTSDRAYRTGMPHDKAIGILRDGSGSQWDSQAIEAFLQIAPEIVTIREAYQPRQRPNRQPAQDHGSAS